MYVGTTNPKSTTYCTYLFGTSASSLAGGSAENDSTMLFAKLAYNTFFDWVTSEYPEAFD